jgi:hypothetical protein
MTKAQAQEQLDAAVADRRLLLQEQRREKDKLKDVHAIQLKESNAVVTKAKRRCGSVAAAESATKAEAAAERAAKAEARAAAESPKAQE